MLQRLPVQPRGPGEPTHNVHIEREIVTESNAKVNFAVSSLSLPSQYTFSDHYC